MAYLSFVYVVLAFCLGLNLIHDVEANPADTSSLVSVFKWSSSVVRPEYAVMESIEQIRKEYYPSEKEIMEAAKKNLVEGLRKYTNLKESVISSCQVLARLNKDTFRNCETECEVVIKKNAKSGRIHITDRDLKVMGYFEVLDIEDCKASKITMPRVGVRLLYLKNNHRSIDNGDDTDPRYMIGTTFRRLFEIMKIRDPFKRLAAMVDRRILKIEVAIEDDVEGMYEIYYNDFQRPDTVKIKKNNFTFDGKKMGLYKFKMQKKGYLRQPVLVKHAAYLVWSKKNKKYYVKRVSPTNDKCFLLSNSLRPKKAPKAKAIKPKGNTSSNFQNIT